MQMQARSLISAASPSSPSFTTHSSGRLAEIAARVVDEEEDDDFEFAIVCRDPEVSPVSADEIFYDGQIRPIYPVFNTNLLKNSIDQIQTPASNSKPPRSHRLPLRELMNEDGERTDDELDRVTPGTYCVWTPKAAPTSAKIDTGSGPSSKRWKLKELLYTSGGDAVNRDGKAGDMRRSLLPNRQDLAGIFSNINGLSRSLHPF
ncbi:hypothetical protein V6N12_013538 [Hibiscus sabdariffa]|uniref:Uncharacterized protein n=2 Tax=Hibiscus sabdariffa TaxID=183260 RepID=A0ABR2CBL8_9ROSI